MRARPRSQLKISFESTPVQEPLRDLAYQEKQKAIGERWKNSKLYINSLEDKLKMSVDRHSETAQDAW